MPVNGHFYLYNYNSIYAFLFNPNRCYCRNIVDVTSSTEDGSIIGGITGNNYSGSAITNCINEGYIYGSSYVGGIAGRTVIQLKRF